MTISRRTRPSVPASLAALRFIERYLLLGIIGLLFVGFWRIEPAGWLNTQTVQFIISQNAPLEIIAVGMTFAIIAGNIDLSPGSMLSLAGMVMGLAFLHLHDLWAAAAIGLVLCLLVGLFNGALVARLRLSAIVVTLATYIWAAGFATSIYSAQAIQVHGAIVNLLNAQSGGWTGAILLVVVCYAGGHLLLTRTRFGRYARAIGGNLEFARRAGVPVRRYTVLVFVFMGVMIWLGTLTSVSQLGAAQPLAGAGLELEAIVAVVVGGARLNGGEGSVLRTAMGAALLAVLNNGLSNLGLSDAYYGLWEGVALIVILALAVVLRWAVRSANDPEEARERPAAPLVTAA